MRSILFFTINAVFLVLPLLLFAWAVRRWLRDRSNASTATWRSYFAVASLAFSGVAYLLLVPLILFGEEIGGHAFFMLHTMYGWGAVIAAAGFLISLIGNGILKWPAITLSLLMAALWCLNAFPAPR